MKKDFIQLNESLSQILVLLNQVEEITMSIIANDSFDDIPDDLQDIVYLLNNYEMENVSLKEIKDAQSRVATKLSIWEPLSD